MTKLTEAQFSMQCAWIAKNAASWAGDILTLPENYGSEADPNTVGRFTDEMRERLDRLDKLAGRSSPPAQTQPVEAQGDVAVAIRHIWTPSNNDGVAWRDVPQHLKDAAKEYRKAIEPATIHHHGKVSGEVFWGYAVEWAFVAGVLSAAPQPAVAVGEVERLTEALTAIDKEAGKATSSTYAVAVSACQRIRDLARAALHGSEKGEA